MKRVTCSDLTTECEAEFFGRTTNEIVVQYVLHASYSHRREAIRVEDLLSAITPYDRRSPEVRQRASVA